MRTNTKKLILIILIISATTIIHATITTATDCECANDNNCASNEWCKRTRDICEIVTRGSLPNFNGLCVTCYSVEGTSCARNRQCCSNNCDNSHCCPTGKIWDNAQGRCIETATCAICSYDDCSGTSTTQPRCGQNGRVGGIQLAAQSCDLNDDKRFLCCGTEWYSCDPTNTWPWVENVASNGETRCGYCCDYSQTGNYRWSYCGDGKTNTVCGEECDDGNTNNGDGCSSTCQLEGCANCGDSTWDCTGNDNKHCGDNGDISIPYVYTTSTDTCNPNTDTRFLCSGGKWHACRTGSTTWTWIDGTYNTGGEVVGGLCCDPSTNPTFWTRCGDGLLNTICGEECEGTSTQTRSCTKSCTQKKCSDGSCVSQTISVSGTQSRTCTNCKWSSWSSCSGTCPADECSTNNDCCIPQYQNNCDNNDGCGSTRSTAPYNSCALTSDTSCGTETSKCNNGIDDDCDNEWDYDTLDRGTAGNIPPHGDSDCPVGISGSPVVSNSKPLAGSTIDIECPSTVAGVNSIQAFLDSTNVESYFTHWSGNNAVFSDVPVGSATGTKTVRCSVDTSKSYQSGSNTTTTINVQPSTCSGYTTPATCNAAAVPGGCEWCEDCNANNQYSGGSNRCVPLGDCSYSCNDAQCGAECDASTNPSCITGEGYAGLRNCDLTDCTWESCIAYEYCGDGIINGPEACDDGANNGVPCNPGYGGTCQYCNADCTQLITIIGPYCGDNNIDAPFEQCDNGTYNGEACTPSYGETCPWCDNNCNIRTKTGPYCGDGIINGPEECEGSDCQPGCTGIRCNATTCQWYDPSPENNCNDDIDNDCDCATDGCDSDCQEGDGINFRCCDDGLDNDGDGFVDEDDPGCCDTCISQGYGFDDPSTTCGGITILEWELSPPDMKPRCCGDDDPEENYITTTIGTNTYHACCDQPTDCVDQNGNCQDGKEETMSLCTDGQDNDCDGLIDISDTNCTALLQGYVFNQKGIPIGGATITSNPPGLGPPYQKTSTPTTTDGHYTLNPLVGTYTFIARKKGYDDNISIATITSGKTTQLNFTLRNGSCHADCTDYNGNCNPACHNTTFTTGETCEFIHPLCYNRPKGFTATLINKTTNTITEYTCCEGPTKTYPLMKTKIKGDVENLYDYVINVQLGGRRVKMHILTWD